MERGTGLEIFWKKYKQEEDYFTFQKSFDNDFGNVKCEIKILDSFNKFASFFKKHWRMEKFLTILLHYLVKLFHLKPCRMENNHDNTFKLNIKHNQNKKEISSQKLSSGSASTLLISWNIIYGVIYLVRTQNFPKKMYLMDGPYC